MRLSCSIQAKLPVKFCLALDTEKVIFGGDIRTREYLDFEGKTIQTKFCFCHENELVSTKIEVTVLVTVRIIFHISPATVN